MNHLEAEHRKRLGLIREKPVIINALRRLAHELPDTLRYHVASHTDDVLSETILFALHDGLDDRRVELLSVGAAYHDLGFIESARENEGLGARLAVKAMEDIGGYSTEEIRAVETMILDTQLRFTEAGPKQVPSAELSRYLLDADVSNLGRDDFFEKAELVRQEVGLHDKASFFQGLVKFMGAHEWYTDAAKALRQPKKDENVRELEECLKRGVLPV